MLIKRLKGLAVLAALFDWVGCGGVEGVGVLQQAGAGGSYLGPSSASVPGEIKAPGGMTPTGVDAAAKICEAQLGAHAHMCNVYEMHDAVANPSDVPMWVADLPNCADFTTSAAGSQGRVYQLKATGSYSLLVSCSTFHPFACCS